MRIPAPSRRFAIIYLALSALLVLGIFWLGTPRTRFTLINRTGRVVRDLEVRLHDGRTWKIGTIDDGASHVETVRSPADERGMIALVVIMHDIKSGEDRQTFFFPKLLGFDCPSWEMTLDESKTPGSDRYSLRIARSPHRQSVGTIVEDWRCRWAGLPVPNRSRMSSASFDAYRGPRP